MKRTAETIIREHYNLPKSRKLTQAEIDAEIANTKRRADAMIMDYRDERLHAALVIAGHLPREAN